MKQISGKDFLKLLAKKGWRLVRVNGSHHIHVKEGHRERISVPVHGNQPLKIGLIKSLMRTADIDEAEL